jgi:D-tyrosyl-tRNA(Tyr) deacylase
MRTIIQRVTSASVTIPIISTTTTTTTTKCISQIRNGLLILIGIGRNDTKADAEYIANKIVNIRLWDTTKPWNASVIDMQYEVLIVSQFTLYANLKGNRPDFHNAMAPEDGKVAYDAFVKLVKQKYNPDKVFEGEYGAMMQVGLVNDGPVTITLDSEVDTDLSRIKAKELKGLERFKNNNNNHNNNHNNNNNNNHNKSGTAQLTESTEKVSESTTQTNGL